MGNKNNEVTQLIRKEKASLWNNGFFLMLTPYVTCAWNLFLALVGILNLVGIFNQCTFLIHFSNSFNNTILEAKEYVESKVGKLKSSQS